MAPTQCAESVGNFKKQLTTLSLDALNLPRQSTYKDNKAAAYLHWTIWKHYNIKGQDKHYENEPATVTENQTATILWDMPIQTDKEIKANRPDILDQDISVDTYNATLGEVYNAHFPLQTRWVTHRLRSAWYTSDLRAMKREKRQSERKFRKSRLEVHKQLFEESCATYNSLLESTKCSYYKQKIENSNTKQLFRMIDGFFSL